MDRKTEFFNAIKAGDVDKIKPMLEEDPKLLVERDATGVSALLTAVYYSRQAAADLLLSYHPTLDIWEASAVGNLRRVKHLLDKDASLVNKFSSDGYTPLGLAAFFGRLKVLNTLLERGADVNIASHNTMHVAPLHSAAAHGSLDVSRQMMALLLEKGAEVNAMQMGRYTALHEAASRGDLVMIELLLQHGADPSARTEDGKSPIDLARQNHHEDAAARLEASREP